jgi:deoxyadenosine/deoxycytidine kinase
MDKTVRIAVVGPCSAGKSLLVEELRRLGYEARQPAQEHSYVADMWRRLTRPDLLVFLDVDYASAHVRRPTTTTPQRLVEQQERLRHARQHCDFYLDTSGLDPDGVKTAVLDFLKSAVS